MRGIPAWLWLPVFPDRRREIGDSVRAGRNNANPVTKRSSGFQCWWRLLPAHFSRSRSSLLLPGNGGRLYPFIITAFFRLVQGVCHKKQPQQSAFFVKTDKTAGCSPLPTHSRMNGEVKRVRSCRGDTPDSVQKTIKFRICGFGVRIREIMPGTARFRMRNGRISAHFFWTNCV